MLRRTIQLLLAFMILVHSPSLARAAASLQLLSPYGGSTCGANTFATAIDASGVLTCSTPTASTLLSGIAAATGANTIASGNNTGQVWNWANTTDSTVAFTFGETSAATNGTITTGVPNQVLLKLSTLAASTMSPLQVYSRGSHVFSVSPSTAQILLTDGSSSAPAITFTSMFHYGNRPVGIWTQNNMLAMQGRDNVSKPVFVGSTGGTAQAAFLVFRSEAPDPTVASVTSSFNLTHDGFFFPSNGGSGQQIGVALNSIELSRWSNTVGPGAVVGLTHSYGAADATSFNERFRKSRGTVLSPTVITTGDDLATISGYGYVGATNTYQEAAKILFDSTGTISDSATGIAGIIRFYTAATGAEPAEKWTMDNTGNLISAGVTQANLGTPADGSIIYCSDCTIANPCAGGGTGAIAKRLNGAWVCN